MVAFTMPTEAVEIEAVYKTAELVSVIATSDTNKISTGESVKVSVALSDDELVDYQWYCKLGGTMLDQALENGPDLSGAQTDTLVYTVPTDSGLRLDMDLYFYCIVTSQEDSDVTVRSNDVLVKLQYVHEINSVDSKAMYGIAQILFTYAGLELKVVADKIPGKKFVGWNVSDNVILADPNSPSTTFIMPSTDVYIEALFEHDYAPAYVKDGIENHIYHWSACDIDACEEALSDNEYHVDLDLNQVCDVCGYDMTNISDEDAYRVEIEVPEHGSVPEVFIDNKVDGIISAKWYQGDAEVVDTMKEGESYTAKIVMDKKTAEKPFYINGVLHDYSEFYNAADDNIVISWDVVCDSHLACRNEWITSKYEHFEQCVLCKKKINENKHADTDLDGKCDSCLADMPSEDKNDTETEKIEKTLTIGEKYVDETTKSVYKVTEVSTALKMGTVSLVGTLAGNVDSFVTPDIIVINGMKYKVTEIADNAFKNNRKLKKFKIGSNIIKIGKNAFYGCKKLKTVSGGKNVEIIKDKAFYKCIALTKFTLQSKVKKIGKSTFYGCKKMKSVTIKTTKLKTKYVGSKAFKGIHAKAVVKVPSNKRKAYKKLLKSKGISGKQQKIKK